MAGLWERIIRVDARVWFGAALVLSAAGYMGSESSPWPWVIPHALILAALWRGSQTAWALLLTVTAVFASLLLIFGVAAVFGTGFHLHVRWWGPLAHGTALILLAAFRGSRLRRIRRTPAHPAQASTPA